MVFHFRSNSDLAPPHSFSGITASITSQLDLFNNINIIILFLVVKVHQVMKFLIMKQLLTFVIY